MCTFVWMKMCTYVQGKSGPELELSIRDAQGTSFKKALTFRCWPCICLTPGVSASLNIGLGCFTISLQSQPWDIHTCLQMGHYWRWISQGRAHNLVLKSLNQRSVSQLVQLLSRVQRFATPWIAARPPCPSPTPGVHSDSCPTSWWCHPAISSSVVPFSSCPQSLPASVSSNESTLRMRWPKYWSFRFP